MDMQGKKIGRLLVKSPAGRNKHGALLWLCLCDCGLEVITTGNNMRNGKAKSCGCLKIETASNLNRTHGLSKTKTYAIWKGMIRRCENPNEQNYQYYGARGIKVCDRWRNDYKNFLADMGEKPQGLSIDRINNSGDYEPSNCRWSDVFRQASNKSKPKNNTSGIKNVHWLKAIKRWRVSITINNKIRYFGHYVDKADAEKAASAARKEYAYV